MVRRRTLTPDEKADWRKIARSVKPIDETRARSLVEDTLQSTIEGRKPSKPKKTKAPRPLHGTQVTHPLHHHAPVPVDRSTEKRVRRGKLDLDARIDLHGLTQDQALSSLTHFLRMAWSEGYRNVLVITGKGISHREREGDPWEYPEKPGVLRRKLPEWLGNPQLSQWVSGYSSAHTRHGGAGAFYVTLRVKPARG